MARSTTTCVHCGYDLAGLGRERLRFTCPECGHEFDTSMQRYPKPWPSTRVMLLLLTVPMTLICALVLGMMWLLRGAIASSAMPVLASVMMGVTCCAALAIPIALAWRLCTAHVLPYERGVVGGVLTAVGLIYTVVAALATIVGVGLLVGP